MWWYWWVTGQMLEGRLWLGRALAATAGEVTPPRGRALRAAAALARNSGDLAEARRLGEEVVRDRFLDLHRPREQLLAVRDNLETWSQLCVDSLERLLR